MRTWKDWLCAAIGLGCFVWAHIYVFAIAQPAGAPMNGVFYPDQDLKRKWIEYMAAHPEMYPDFDPTRFK